MGKTAAVKAPDPDPVAERVAVLERVRARRPPDRVLTYPSLDGRPGMRQHIPPDADRLPPADVGAWVDDRVLATFGSRTGLNPGEQIAYDILTAMRSGDPDTVRSAVRRHAGSADVFVRFNVSGVLEEWRGRAPGFALDVAMAAITEARRLRWDQRPRRRSLAPPPVSQVPGRRAG